jgi:glutathione S-transferase
MPVTLYAASYSPWSEKARWALDRAGVSFAEVGYIPLLSEAAFRLKRGSLTGAVSIPTLLGAEGPISDSLLIARWADGQGDGSLFPEAHLEEIEEWNYRCEAALSAGRILATRRVAGSEPARREALPAPLRGALYPFFAPLADLGIAFLTRKYRFGEASSESAEQAIRKTLESGRLAIRGEGGHPVGDRFTFADIALANSLHFVSPHASLKMGEATRACFTQAALAQEFADLLAWRDACYEAHRRRAR